ncbi:hypothetical protein K431DRAFT_212525, partial [Polychaeton citri CBS 116435]
SHVFIANAATQFSLAPGQTLTPGGTAVIDGTTVSLGKSATNVVINGRTQALNAPMITPAPFITVDGTVYQPNLQSTYYIDGHALTPGGIITADGTTISLAAGASAVVINGVTRTLDSSPNGGAAATTAQAVTASGPTVT